MLREGTVVEALLLIIMMGSADGPKVTATIYPGTMSECLDRITGKTYSPRVRLHCIPYAEGGAQFPKRVMRDLGSLPVEPVAPVRTDDLLSPPRG